MTSTLNSYNQPIGDSLPDWKPAKLPTDVLIKGKFCYLERLDSKKHARELFEANRLDQDGQNWTYLPYGPFANFEEFNKWVELMSIESDPYFYAIIDSSISQAVGVASLMRIFPDVGSIEVGHLNFSPLLQKKIAATEAMYLLMNYSFELGYRRYEWKCDHLNAPSRSAALRLGFKYEGTFRQATIYKGRTRDTDWFSIIDSEWLKLKAAYSIWLDENNFDQNQKQILSLRDLTS